MKIAVGTRDVHFLVDQAAQGGRNHGRARIPHAGVAHQRKVELELVGMLLDEPEEVIGATLLFALDHRSDRQRQGSRDLAVGAARLDKGHHLALVVTGSTRDDHLAAVRSRDEARCKRRCLPQFERIDRLNVIVAVEQKARLAAAGTAGLAHHDRISIRRSDAGLETNTGEILRNVLCRIQALCLVGRIGRN